MREFSTRAGGAEHLNCKNQQGKVHQELLFHAVTANAWESGAEGARMWPRGLDDSNEIADTWAQFLWPTKATAPPPSVILGTFANRNTHDKSGSGSNVRGLKSSTAKSIQNSVWGKGWYQGMRNVHV